MGTAALLGAFLGQREGDILRLTWSSYHDGAFPLRQRKTGQWVDVPALSELAARLARTPRTAPAIVVSESTGRPYRADHFRHAFAKVRTADADEVPELAGLWFMDLRRTAVVWLAEAGCDALQIANVTGHEYTSINQILKVYLPRRGGLAKLAIENLARRRAESKQGNGK